jgi:NADH-quinone oxidoreductase subunit G
VSDQPAATDQLTINVDGRPVPAHKGEYIIAAAERAGVYIPRFCYHPRMSSVGVCRMCLVDLKGPRGSSLVPACYTNVAEGQEITTASAKVRKAQDGVLEFLLVNHPLDCPVCDKGGECPLQDQTLAFGPGETRFVEEKRHWEKPIPLSDLVLLDRERCIQCSRCTRFADEVAGDPLIDFADRGDRTEVATFPDGPFASYFSGNTVQICPVGALTAKPYRFKARPWDLEQVESTCTSCSVGCRVAVQSSSDRITRSLGIDSDPVNWSWLCDKGRFDFEANEHPDRLGAPLVRRGGRLVEVGWAEALSVAAAGLAAARDAAAPITPDDEGETLDSEEGEPAGELRPASIGVAVLGGSRLSNEDAYLWAKIARTALATDHVDAQMGDGLPAKALLGLPRATIDQAAAAGLVINAGPDIKEELPVLYLRLRHAAVNDGLKIAELSPAGTGLSRYATHSLSFRPGELAQVVGALTATDEPTEAVAGVPAPQLNALRSLISTASERRRGPGPAVVVLAGRQSFAESADTTVEALEGLRGIDGVAFLPVLRRSNVHGALDMGLAPGVLPGRVSLEEGREWYEQRWGSALPAEAGLDASGILAEAAEGRLGALVLLGADPLADFPDRRLAERALGAVPFTVAVDCFLTPSNARADVILPAAAYGERRGTFTNIEGRISWLGQKVSAPGSAWPDWMIAIELAARLGCDLGVDDLESIWAEIGATSPAHLGVDASVLTGPQARDGILIPYDPATAAEPRSKLVIDPMSDPGIGSAELHVLVATSLEMGSPQMGPPPGGVAALLAGGPPPDGGVQPPPLLSFSASANGSQPAVPDEPADGLRLVAVRTLWDHGTLVAHSSSLAGLAPAQRLRVHPDDVARLGLGGPAVSADGAGGEVLVSSANGGSVTASLQADPRVARGAAVLTVNVAGANPTELIDAAARFTAIRLERI